VVLRADYSRAQEHESEAKNIYDPNPNPYQETSDWPGSFSYNQTIVSGTITYDMPWATLKSLSSGQWMHQFGSESDGGLDLALAQPNVATQQTVEYMLHDSRAVTQELDLSSKPGSALTWVVGAFYLQSRLNVSLDAYVRNTYDTVNPDILNNQLESLVLTQLQDGTLYYESVATQRRTSVSGFGQASHDITDALSATAGFRYTEDRNSTVDTTYFGDTNYGGGVLNLAQKAVRFTYRAELDYRLTPDNFLYGSVSTGFKPGGGNLSTAPAVVPLNYKPEDITAFELGAKNKFFDNGVTANLAGFYYVDHHLQYHAEDLINFQGGVANLPRVDVYGIEGEFSVRLPFDFHLDGNATVESGKIATHVLTIDNLAGIAANDAFINQYGYEEFLTTEYGSPNNPVPNAAQILTGLRQAAYRDVYGNAPPNLPKVTATAALSQDYKFGNGSNLLSRLQIQYRDDYYNTVFKSPVYITPGFVLANLLFDYTSPNTKWDVSFAIDNLADKAAVAYRMTNQYGGTTVQTYYPPREFIGSIRYRF
jgi:iron complex outermembrane receptor protein